MADPANGLAKNLSPARLGSEPVASDFARVNRALRTLGAGNRTLLRASEEQELLREMCQVIVEIGGYRAAAVGYAERDENQSIRWMACIGIEAAFLQSIPFTWADNELGSGAVGTAIRTRRPSVARNYLTDAVYIGPAYDRLREYAGQHGHAAITAFPLIVEGEALGALAMAASEPNAFDEDELALLTELADDLAYGIASLRTRKQHFDAQATIRHLAFYDSLTDLPNRLQLVERLDAVIQVAKNQHKTLALLHLDVGRFHEINKVLGYRAGDELVRALARRLEPEVQTDVTLARVGETEFALLLPNCGVEHAVTVAQRLAGTLLEPIEVSGLMVDPQVGIGIALFPGHASDADTLIRRAHAAVRQAISERGDFAIYTGGQETENTRRLALMGDLRQAIKNNELRLYCQPKVDIATRRVRSAEALMRWHHPLHGNVSPTEFIQLAEHAGTITPLTNWMLDAAFRQCHAWKEAGLERALAINLSAHDLYDPRLIDRIRDLFTTWGIAPDLIQFELTESSLMADPVRALETLTRLKRLDVELFVDDYGTGYSSLSYLQKLPVDAIKIDQSFVTLMEASADSAVIVTSTIELGHKLDLKVVAEGVETEAVWDRLAALGCDVAQGYLISQPMPAEQFLEWQRTWSLHGALERRNVAMVRGVGP